METLLGRIPIILLLLAPLTSSAQEDGWLKIESGSVQYLDPGLNEWRPASDGERVPLDTYLLVSTQAEALLFKETVTIELPPDAYFYLRDAVPQSRVELVGGLTRIEASQLPSNVRPREEDRIPVGLTYGSSAEERDGLLEIPHRAEREQGIDWFLNRQRNDAALLSIKRMMTRFPSLYAEQEYLVQLLDLYDRLELYGFLFDETERLLKVEADETLRRTIRTWNETARERLKTSQQ